MSYGSDFVLTLFTNDLELARRADEAGIDRIGLDLERIGKAERQGHLKSWVSDHEEHSLPAIRRTLRRAKLFVRTNPFHPGLGEEIDEVKAVMRDLREHDCDMLTVGQYLQPSRDHLPVVRYVHPDEFEHLRELGEAMGFTHVASGPLVRSSYHADQQASGVLPD